MFSIDIPVISWILWSLEIVIPILLFIIILRPLRRVIKMPYAEPYIEQEEEEVVSVEEEESQGEESAEEKIHEEESLEEETHEEEESVEGEPAEEGSEVIEEELEVSIIPQKKPLPKASVIVYSTVDEDRLTEFLKSVCTQKYPDFEVIVVCDATFEASGILSEKYAELFRNVYVTFIPPGSHNLSRRKLAQTIGIKAAKGDVVVITLANAVISSDLWLATMMKPFIDDSAIQIALGYSHPDYSHLSSPGRLYSEFFALLTDARWMGYALNGHTYRGDGANIAMRRSTFFDSKGYSSTIHLHAGDDDIFVHDIANGYNIALAVSPESDIITRWGDATKRIVSLRRSQYDFTARWLPMGPFVRSGLASMSQWIVLLSGIGSALFALPNLVPTIAAAVVWITFMIVESAFYRKLAIKLGATPLSWQAPLFWLIKPLNNLWFRSAHRSSRFKNFTWQRHKHAN
ncbi:MAG: glycosyltransferase [Muribaculaceae bacterium]|nr:glycosyltransferase [Muribaculaceae bacterium]